MKPFIVYFSTLCILGVSFYGLFMISKDNEYTSVRKYLLPLETISDSGSTLESSGFLDNSGTTLELTGTVNDSQSGVILDSIAPTVEIVNYKNGDIVTDESIDIKLTFSDDITSTKNIKTTGGGIHTLEKGFNPIVVSATDEAGNVGTTYIIIEKK